MKCRNQGAWEVSALIALCLTVGVAIAQDVPYGLASWPEPGRGNHRALLRVTKPAAAVWAHIEWRRRDRQPEAKDVRVLEAATGKRITNVVRVNINREFGDLVFESATAPGNYEVYYLPYNPGVGNFDDAGTYFNPQDTADAEWVQRNGLTPEAMKQGRWRSLPRAEVVAIQARGEFHRMDPMEVIATEAEVAQLLQAHPDQSYLVFPEDREFPIRMPDDLPLKWIKSGPRNEFTGKAQPGEYYSYQIGVWAARQAIRNLSLEFGNLKNEKGDTIPAKEMTCLNLTGIDWLGRTMRKTFEVGKGMVQPLWCGVQIPKGARGTYRGTVVVTPQFGEGLRPRRPADPPQFGEGLRPRRPADRRSPESRSETSLNATRVTVEIEVSGSVLSDGGLNDLWRLSRLKWLNSTLGLDDEVVPPYTPLRVEGNYVKCLGRAVRFGPLGLPESILSNGRELLAAPMAFVIEAPTGPLRLAPERTELPKVARGTVERLIEARGLLASGSSRPTSRTPRPNVFLTVRSKMELDGCLTYTASLKAKSVVALKDIRLEVPMKRSVATYMMGMGKRGGYRVKEWSWKWDLNRANNQVWLGDAEGGLQLYLREPKDIWDVTTLRDAGLPPSWHNEGKGGCEVKEVGDKVMIRAYSSDRTLRPGQELEFRFRFLVTPFKPIDKRHWNWRYGDVNGDGNVLHIHHGCPENPYINYPFIETKLLADTIRSAKNVVKRTDFGKLTYPAEGNLKPDRGAVHVWARVNFDPKEGFAGQGRYNQALFYLNYPNEDEVGFYWNIDDRGMRAYVRKGAPERNQYPMLFGTNSPDWEKGQRHVLTLSWGDQLAIFVDGRLKGAAPYRGTLDTPLQGATIDLLGEGFLVEAVKISDAPFVEGTLLKPEGDEHTLLLDAFTKVEGTTKTFPEKIVAGGYGTLTGTIKWNPGDPGRELQFSSRPVEGQRNGVNVYYTLGQISNHVAEMWPLRSLGDEVLQTRSSVVMTVGDTEFGKAGGGYPWLQEHLVSDYVPAWRQPLPWLQDTCAALGTQGISRWHNYYVEGMQWLMRNTGLDGLYLDGIGYDRETMKRIAKVMQRNSPDYRINFHSGDSWSSPWDKDRKVSPANRYMEHFPYVSNLWFGELYDYNSAPDYWLVEISGIPFGLTGEMLNYENGGNPYRGMVYGMTGRQHPSAPHMWRFWDSFGIQEAEGLGYWSPKCPVKTDHPGVLASVYRKPGKSLIALAHWPAERPRGKAIARATTKPPVVDGRLDPGEWEGAAKLTNFTRLGSDALADDQTEVYIAYDAERLYLAFRCLNPSNRLKADAKERDGMVWEDDAVEIFLQPDLRDSSYFQFIGNSAGVFYDGKGLGSSKWNGDWTYRASVGNGSWEGELSSPFSSLGMKQPAEGATIGLNLCRDQQSPQQRLSSWSPLSGSFHDTEQFGRLTFTRTEALTRQEPQDVEPGRRAIKVHLDIDWKALGLNPTKAKLTAPSIEYFQNSAAFSPEDAIPVEPGKGWLLVVHE